MAALLTETRSVTGACEHGVMLWGRFGETAEKIMEPKIRGWVIASELYLRGHGALAVLSRRCVVTFVIGMQ